MAPPRRISCLNCVKAKRRCDQASPQCHRCATKNLTCDHPRLENGAPDSNTFLGQERVNQPFTQQDWLIDNGTPSSDTILGQEQMNRPFTQPDWLIDNNPAISNSIMGDGQPPIESTWLATLTSNPNTSLHIEWPPFNAENHSNWLQDSSPPADINEIINAAPLTSEANGDHITTGAIYHERTRFASRQFKSYPEMFYKYGQTMFIHRHLYEEHAPQVIQDVLGSCALYCGKNEHNESLVFSHISRKAMDLVNRQMPFLTPVDLLASTQALLLYQIIRFFDGDIRQRADAETHESILVSWTEQLQRKTQQLPLIADSSVSGTPDSITTKSWDDWVFDESCRRTVLTSYILQGTYSFLKFGWDNVSRKVSELSFTAQATLWNAPSEFHWRDSSKDKKPFQVTICQWDVDMEGVKPTDLEELGILMMALIKGMDITCDWLGRENLTRWGLEWGTRQTKDS